MKAHKNEAAPKAISLSYREKEVLKLMAQRNTIAEIADAMMLVPMSVHTILRNVKLKLGLNSMVELRAYAIEQKLT